MKNTLLIAGRIYDGRSQSTLEHAFVGIEAGRICAVGLQNELGASGASNYAQVIDLGPDSCLLPGLINMHTHMSFSGGDRVFQDVTTDSDPVLMLRIAENLRAALFTGVTTIRDCGTSPHLALPTRDAVEQGILRGPRLFSSGAITTTGGHCWYCATEADDEAAIRQAVRAHVKSGVDFIKLFATGGNLTPGTNSVAAQYSEKELCAATEEARRLGRITASHAHGTGGVRHSITARVTTIEHCSFQTESGIGWDPQLADQVAEHGIVVCPTVFRGLTKQMHEPGFEPNPAQARAIEVRKARLALTAKLAEAGVTLVAGNDAGVTQCNFSDFPEDLVLTAEGCGFAPADVLASATGVAASVLRRDDIGVIAEGKAADLLAVRGNPLKDIRAITAPKLVVSRGQIVASDAKSESGFSWVNGG